MTPYYPIRITDLEDHVLVGTLLERYGRRSDRAGWSRQRAQREILGLQGEALRMHVTIAPDLSVARLWARLCTVVLDERCMVGYDPAEPLAPLVGRLVQRALPRAAAPRTHHPRLTLRDIARRHGIRPPADPPSSVP
ncbi:MAG TPA: hypothetical protein VF277_09485 [Steroidobacteraceae bacterium]